LPALPEHFMTLIILRFTEKEKRGIGFCRRDVFGVEPDF